MNKYYVTFGTNHRNGNFVQPIYAASEYEAEMKMIEVHGNKYSSCYSEEAFILCKMEGLFRNLIELRPLYTEQVTSFGEMRTLTERFNQIIGASLVNRSKRLDQMFTDICESYGYNCIDPFIVKLTATILDELQGGDYHALLEVEEVS